MSHKLTVYGRNLVTLSVFVFAFIGAGRHTEAVLRNYLNANAVSNTDGITDAERKKSVKLLEDSLNKLITLTKSLSESQLHFRPAKGRWSIMDNVDHLVNVEDVTWDIILASLEKSGEGQKSDISDEEFIRKMSTREKNFTAPPMLQPVENKYKSFDEVVALFNDKRQRTIEFMKTTRKDLRNHFSPNPVFGNLDTYQWTLHPSTHCFRHIEQIEEIMAHRNFPNK